MYFASVNAELLSLATHPFFPLFPICRRICLNLMFSASALLSKSWCPFFAPRAGFLMTASTVTVGTTTYLFPAPLIANYETKPNQVLAATSGPYSYLPTATPFYCIDRKKNPQFIRCRRSQGQLDRQLKST